MITILWKKEKQKETPNTGPLYEYDNCGRGKHQNDPPQRLLWEGEGNTTMLPPPLRRHRYMGGSSVSWTLCLSKVMAVIRLNVSAGLRRRGRRGGPGAGLKQWAVSGLGPAWAREDRAALGLPRNGRTVRRHATKKLGCRRGLLLGNFWALKERETRPEEISGCY